MDTPESNRQHSIIGCILGTAVGDAIGLPMEGLGKARLKRLFTEPLRHRFILGRGMISDDTEHTIMVAQAMIESAGDPKMFKSDLARKMKRWFLLLPGGTGLATLKACLRLLIGYGPDTSGVFSAGNGPAMRSALIGVCYGHQLEKMRELVQASTHITHTDPKAEYGAFAVALAAYMSSFEADVSPRLFLSRLSDHLGDRGSELVDLVKKAVESVDKGESTETFAEDMGWGQGISGYIYATVPVALHAWFRYPGDYKQAVSAVIGCGGDTDTTAAITGAIVGAGVGKEGIPEDWLNGLAESPRSIVWMEELATQLTGVIKTGMINRVIDAPAPAVLVRNLLFITIVLLHGFRRMLPPY